MHSTEIAKRSLALSPWADYNVNRP